MPAVLTIFGFCICSFTSACLGRQRRALVLYLVAVLLGLPVAVGCAVAGWNVYGCAAGLGMGSLALLVVLFMRGFCVFWMRMCRRLNIMIHRMK
jgi:hypothetical protein